MAHDKKNRAVDPLEMAKVGPSKPGPAEPDLVSELIASAAASGAPTALDREDAAERLSGPPTLPPVLATYRVLEDKTISLRGQMVVMRAGRVLTPEFAHVNLPALREQGVKLEEIPPQ